MGLLCFMFIKPVVWLSVLVRYCDDKNMVLIYGVKQLVWEFVQQTFSYITTGYGPALRVRGNSERSLSYFFLEFASKFCMLRVRRTGQHPPIPASRAW